MRATYRLQLRPELGFDAAAAIVDHLRDLGVSHVYCSPYLQAARGSTHGYDVVDHARVNEELGGPDAHARFCARLGEVGLGQVLDVVPNHMAISTENRWWMDVLEHGPGSIYASYFDVDWDPPEQRLRNRILLPVLGDHYGRVLERGELVVAERHAVRGGGPRSDRRPVVTYFEHWFPLNADSMAGHTVDELNADVDALDAVLDQQHYRLAWWKAASKELDYRRFFDIDTLAGLRVEDEVVFEEVHALVVRWLVSGVLDGVRIDHIDGLRTPAAYLSWLRERAPDAYVVVEKILEPGEALPPWPCDGTTGYDFLNRVTRVLNHPDGESAFTDAYARFTGEEPVDFADVAYEKKRLVLRDLLGADLLRLTNLFVQLCESERRYRDFTRPELHAVLREALACFGVYRTYVVPGEPVSAADDAHITQALKTAAERRPETDAELWDLLGRVLRGEIGDELCLRFQQTSGPVMAKGVEDTAFYCFNRYVALNEVGGDPGRWCDDVATFHATSVRAWPRSMLASTTHDTKRSEDVRARLLVLAEIPERFAAAAARWRDLNERHWTIEPDRNLEWLLYQTLVGAHPLSSSRALRYVDKVMREAKVHTSWTEPNEPYEDGVRAFVAGILGDDAFTADLAAFVEPLVEPGRSNSLAMQAIKLMHPGVPDIYQGTELWDLSLVDPDNRRPVDHDERRRLLAEGTHPKLTLTSRLLHLDVGGDYAPVEVEGEAAEHVLAFARGGRHLTVVTRFPLRLAERGGFGDTTVTVPLGDWTDVLTGASVRGGAVPVGQVLGNVAATVLEAG